MLTRSLDSFQTERFEEPVNQKKRKRLSVEYENLNTETKLPYYEQCQQYKTGNIYPNRLKNRYSNVIPLESTRVKLEGLKNDYINANHVKIPDIVMNFISTQAPISATYQDFWKMVWDQKSSTIIMLTDFEENGKLKASQYWGTKNVIKSFTYTSEETTDNIEYKLYVTLIRQTNLAKFMILREFSLSKDGEVRTVVHIQYTNWGDHQKPTSTSDIQRLIIYMSMFKTIGHISKLEGPAIIHCSAGIGRSGTFIACALVKYIRLKKREVNISQIVSNLRKCRSGMVQTDEQYAFIYKFNEYLNK
jgi:protein tyrosine phosphatase